MDCSTCASLAGAYADGELELSQALALEAHLEKCQPCQQAYAALRELRRAVRQEATYFAAPGELAGRIQAQLRGPEGHTARPAQGAVWRRSGATTTRPQIPVPPSRQWAAVGAAIAFALLLGINIDLYRHQAAAGKPSIQALVDDHVRSLVTGHLMDVPSADTHTVKPWFNGKLDFSPPVQDLKTQGFPLAGGRLDVVDGHPAAVLVYYRRRHPINVFIWPVPESKQTPPDFSAQRGYHLAHWREAGMSFWVVSDLNQAELQQFVRLLSQSTEGAAGA